MAKKNLNRGGSPKTPHVDSALAYCKAVLAGKILACKWVRLACQRHLDDLKKKDWPYKFDKGKADRACKFIELLPHTKGEWASQKETITLQPWQCFIVCSIFGWVEKKGGYRRFREAMCEIPRKNGKSLTAAAIGLYLFAGDGEFGSEIYSGATSEKQAWEIFRPAQLIAKRTPDLCEAYGITVNAGSLTILNNGSRFEPLIGNPGDGASPSCALIDEYHEHPTPALYDTMVTGMGARRQPLTLIVTTAGNNLSGPCYMKRSEVCKALEGTIQNDRLFGLIYTIDDDDAWDSEEALRKANPNFGVSVLGDYLLDRQCNARQTALLQNPFKTKHLNIWVGAYQAWMNMLKWQECGKLPRKPLAELAGRTCFLGLDLASKIDIAALVALFPPTSEDPLWHVHGRYYLPEAAIEERRGANVSHYEAWEKQGLLTLTPGEVLDFEFVKEDLRWFSSQFAVKEVPFDPWQATQLANEMLGEGATMVEFRPTVAHFSEPMKELEKLVMQKLLAHGGCPILTWMMSNVVARADKKDNIFPVKEVMDNKIDGVVAALMALGRAIMQPAPVRSVYEDRGVMMIGGQ